MSDFAVALSDLARAYPALLPPNRMRVSEGAAKSLIIKRPGGASGNWNPHETPYMVEPVDMLASRRHSAVCFVGPAQTGKTVGLGEGWLTHAVLNDPGDMAIIQMTQEKAREYSRQRIDRAIRNSPDLKAMRSASGRDDNLHDKAFANGMMLRIAWPTGSNLSSTSYRYVFGTDYDRWNGGREDVDGEGDGFTLMGKRVTTFLSRGMVAVESSPGRLFNDPTWVPATPHEAPPVGTAETGSGILGIYNRGDRRRLYWKCPGCGEWIQASPGLGLFNLPDNDTLIEDIRDIDIDVFARQHARVLCPHNGCVIQPDQREGMNRAILTGRGGWLQDGLYADSHDRISGTPRTSSIASYWMGGVAATYVSWETLIRKHMQALLDYTMTGNELPLQTTINTDQGLPYMSRHLVEAQDSNKQGRRVVHGMQRYIVPDAARFLVAKVDVQGGKHARFEVQIMGVGEHKEQWLVDRYSIRWSKRQGMGDTFAPIDPAAYPEDWDLITERVVDATYRTNDPNREMRVHRTMVDSGGEDGVTDKAYAWYRRLRKYGRGRHRSVRLTKGASGRPDWHTKETMVGSRQGSGDIPLLLFDPNKFKDMVHAGLKRSTPGPGFYHFPEPKGAKNPDGWLPQAFFDELNAEVRNENGVWEQIKPRNETLDLCVLGLVACSDLGCDKKGWWDRPPSWALPRDQGNSGVITPEARRAEQQAAAAATPPPDEAPVPVMQRPVVGERRVSRSSYLA
jgi:phage terminase large subunit GpA-like protein